MRPSLEECLLKITHERYNRKVYRKEKAIYRLASSGGFAERYFKHRTDCALFLSFGKAGKYCVFLHRPFVNEYARPLWLPEDSPKTGNSREQEAVLVDVPVFFESPEVMVPISVRSEARLVSLDEINHRLGHAIQAVFGPLAEPFLGIVQNRKCCRSTGFFDPGVINQLPGEMVESRSEIVKNIADAGKGRRLQRGIGHLNNLLPIL